MHRTSRVVLTVLCAAILIVGVVTVASALPGDLDPTFGTGGRVITDFGLAESGSDLILQPDGKLVMIGWNATAALASPIDILLARYETNGTLDPTFGAGGQVTTDLGGSDAAFAGILQPDGKVVVVGGSSNDSALVRYLPDGSLDPAFGVGGVVTTDLGGFDQILAVDLQPDGKIVVAGRSDQDMVLARFTSAGALDPSFGAAGIMTTDFTDLGFGGDERWNAVVVQPDGNIVAGGKTVPSAIGGDIALARFTSTGTLDPTFGAGGRVTTDVGSQHDAVNGLALQPDGKIVAAGVADNGPPSNFVVVRYDTSGTPDPGFGIGGKVFTDFGGPDGAADVALQPDGKIVAAGGDPTHIAIARYNANGTPDALFGVNGTIETAFPAFGEVTAEGVVLQPDAKIVVGGTTLTEQTPKSELAMARYSGDALTCTIVGTRRNDLINGTRENDVICALDGNDVVAGGTGDDIIFGGLGNDIVFGGAGADQIFGESGNDLLDGGAGAGNIVGGTGADFLLGGAQADVLDGADGLGGNDVLLGGPSVDACTADPGDVTAGCP